MNRITIESGFVKTISWLGDKIVDWTSAGTVYSLDGKVEQINKYHFAYSFDRAINSEDGKYAFICKRLGTKGLLLKDGEIIREINRSYYQSEYYEFPVAFVTIANGTTYIVHCPIEYCRLDFEEVESGAIVTNTPNRKPHDVFHSRLEVSPDNKSLISKGWVWHPWDIIELFDIENCIKKPELLDLGTSVPGSSSEISSASFIDNSKILLCSSLEEPRDDEKEDPVPPGHIAIWDFKKNEMSKPVKVKGEFGNLIAIDDKYCWDLFRYPKIINLETGEVEEKTEDIFTKRQNSSIVSNISDLSLQFAYNKKLQKLAIKNGNKIEVLWK